MVMVLTVLLFRLIVRCLVAYAGGLDVSSFGFIDVSVFGASGNVFHVLFDDLRFNYYGFYPCSLGVLLLFLIVLS
jgi:hypothetical protein